MNIRCWVLDHDWEKETWVNTVGHKKEVKICERCREWEFS